MHIKINFRDQFILIKLLESPAIKKWFDHFKNAITHTDSFYQLTGNLNWYQNIATQFNSMHWDQIIELVEKLKSIGLDLGVELPTEFNRDQKILNFLHRFFTINAMWYHEKDKKLNPFSPNFTLSEDITFNKWIETIDIINANVHNLERYSICTNRDILKQFPIHCVLLVPLWDKITSNDLDHWISFSEEEIIKSNCSKLDYTSGPLVSLNQSILGKCVLQSFLDHDDPTQIDCTGRTGSFGGLVIDLNMNRQKIYQSTEFQTWLNYYNIIDPPLEFPIGNVVYTTINLNDLLMPDVLNYFLLEFKNVEFLD